jgi:F-type H+-transporting ATPase subunit b
MRRLAPWLALGLVLAASLAPAAEKKSGMPQLDPKFFATQIFWLVVTFAIFLIVVWRVVLPKIGNTLEDRQNRIRADLDKAADSKAAAEKAMAGYEKALAESRDKAAGMLRKVSEASAAAAAERTAAVNAKLARDLQAAETRIAKARTDALANIKTVAGDVATAAAERIGGIKADAAAVGRAVETALAQRS